MPVIFLVKYQILIISFTNLYLFLSFPLSLSPLIQAKPYKTVSDLQSHASRAKSHIPQWLISGRQLQDHQSGCCRILETVIWGQVSFYYQMANIKNGKRGTFNYVNSGVRLHKIAHFLCMYFLNEILCFGQILYSLSVSLLS